MKITFIGVGEATDAQPNTSILVEGKSNLLLDCGYSVPPSLWHYSSDPNLIDTIYISHLHADHYFGLAPILLRMIEEKRTKPISIICPQGYDNLIEQSLDLAFGEIFKLQQFSINYHAVTPEDALEIEGYSLSFASTNHLRNNLAIRITDGTHTICYSGDGKMTTESEELFGGSDLLIHDAFHEKNKPPGVPTKHESIESLVEYQQTHLIKLIACVHINKKANYPKTKYQSDSLIFPIVGDSISF